MNSVLQHSSIKSDQIDFEPVFFDLKKRSDKENLLQLLNDKQILVHNTIENQVAELIKIKNASTRFTPEKLKQHVTETFREIDPDEYGIWVYYAWNKTLVHLLSEEDFICVRTHRNMYKITPEELSSLRTKTIAIIGLSVGQSIAQTIATERICGELRLADFDSLELGNLNRLNARVQDIGTPKTIIAARKIAEIDPFIKIKCWVDGINEENIDGFLDDNGKVDVLVEECDSFEIKVLARLKAKEKGIAVLMDTNDKGMIDVERFDLETERTIFHGKVAELEQSPHQQTVELLKNLTLEEKFGYLTRIIGFENISEEMKISLPQLNKTITGWPQLASAVTLGAAVITDTCRRILLNKFTGSGRFFIHFDELVR